MKWFLLKETSTYLFERFILCACPCEYVCALCMSVPLEQRRSPLERGIASGKQPGVPKAQPEPSTRAADTFKTISAGVRVCVLTRHTWNSRGQPARVGSPTTMWVPEN